MLKIENVGKVEYLAEKMNHMSNDAFTVKLADRLDNVKDLSIDYMDFSKRYAKQTHKILQKIESELNPTQKFLMKAIIEKIKEFLD